MDMEKFTPLEGLMKLLDSTSRKPIVHKIPKSYKKKFYDRQYDSDVVLLDPTAIALINMSTFSFYLFQLSIYRHSRNT